MDIRFFKIVLIGLFPLFISGQSFEEHFVQAAESNPALRARYKRFESALTKVAQAQSLPDPKLSYGFFISPVETRVGPQQSRFSLSQAFPWFGTLKKKGQVYALRAEAKYQLFLEAKRKLRLDMAQVYFPLMALHRHQDLERENLKILRSYKQISTSKFENATAPMVDVLRVDLKIKASKSRLENYKYQEEALVAHFNTMLNRAENHPLVIRDSLERLPFLGQRDSLLEQNPRIAFRESLLASHKAEEALAKKKSLPSFSLGLDYLRVGRRPDFTLPGNGRDAIMPMLSISLPIYHQKYKKMKEEAQLLQKAAALEKEEEENKLIREFEKALAQLRRQRELSFLYQAQIEEAQQALQLLLKSYANSSRDFEEILRMQQQLLSYQKDKLSALAAYNVAHFKLKYLTTNTPRNE